MSSETELREAAQRFSKSTCCGCDRDGILFAEIVGPLLEKRDAEIWTFRNALRDEVRVNNRVVRDLVGARRDSARLDFLATELEREGTGYKRALFRRNFPITRESIDAAMEQDK